MNKSFWSVVFSKGGMAFLGAVSTTAIISVIVCTESELITLSARLISIKVAEIISIVLWWALAVSLWERNMDDFFLTAFLFSFSVAPLGLMVVFDANPIQHFLFCWSMVVWCGLATYFSFENDLSITWEKTITMLGILWIIVGGMLTIGHLPWFPFASDLTSYMVEIHTIMDLRLLLSLFLLASIIGTAVYKALLREIPVLKKLNSWKLKEPENRNLISSIRIPMIQFTNIMLIVANNFVDLIWKTLQIVSVFFIRIGEEIALLSKKIILNNFVWLTTARVLLTFVLLVIVFGIAKYATIDIYNYLTTSSWITQFRLLSIIVIKAIFALTAFWGLVWLSIYFLFKSHPSHPKIGIIDLNISMNIAASSSVWLLMVFLMSGIIVYSLNIFIIDLKGYDNIGLYTTVISLFILMGIVRAISIRTEQ